MDIFLDFHFFLFSIHALGSKKHLYSFQEKKIIENSSQQNGCNSGMCFPIHGTISDGINIADYLTSYTEYIEVKFFLKVSLHLKPIPCNENRVFPVKFFLQGNAMRKGVSCNENRFFPVRKTSQGKPCPSRVLALYEIAVCFYLMYANFFAIQENLNFPLKGQC